MCYDPSSHHVFVNLDVTFFESPPFFSVNGNALDIDILYGPVKESSPYVDSQVFVSLPIPVDVGVV